METLQILLKNIHAFAQRHSVIVTQRNTCTPPHLSLAVKGHTPPCDSCQSQEVGIMRSIKNTPKGSGRPWGIEICCMSPLDVTCRKSIALIIQLK